MTITTGDTLPNATLLYMGDDGPASVELKDKLAGRKVVIFGLPGAYTGTCTTAHVPSFIRNAEAFKAKGVDEIICLAVNDPFVLAHWEEHTGAAAAGITTLGDPESKYTTAIGMNFSAPAVGFFERSKRYAMVVVDGVVTVINPETSRSECEISGGENLSDQMV